jgi:uncharacterized protein YwgA
VFFTSTKPRFVPLEEADKIVEIAKNYKNLERKLSVDLRDAVLLLLTSIDYQKSVVSRTLMQKEVFLLYDQVLTPEGLSRGYRDGGFTFYKYGPYSYRLNVVLSSLVFSGIIRVENFYHMDGGDEKPTKRFLTYFQTDADFHEIAKKYDYLISEKSISIEEIKNKIADRKRSWDQSGYKGITRLILENPNYAKEFNKMNLKDAFPEVTFGKITEDYIPRLKVI